MTVPPPLRSTVEVVNFGGNVRFKPKSRYAPETEEDLLQILNRHRDGQVRVVASGHAWSDAIVSEDALVDLRRFDDVRIERQGEEACVVVGGGCGIDRLLKALNRAELTLPSVGLITRQTIAGAISTATHGSGKASLSHYVAALRIACYAGPDRTATVRAVDDGGELRAARCGLGCLGVIVSVKLRCVPQYRVRTATIPCGTLRDVLALETGWPLQQFYLIPHSWRYYAHGRTAVADERPDRWAPLHRLYWFLTVDLGLHLALKLFVSLLSSRRLVRFLYRRLIPLAFALNWSSTDRSDRALVMEHELFCHLEIELFVPAARLEVAMQFVTESLQVADGERSELSPEVRTPLKETGGLEALERLRGTFSHHYPICVRRVLPDDALVSMSSPGRTGDVEPWYALSLITYATPREPFYAVGRFLAESMAESFDARPHWGKWFPLGVEEMNRSYPRLSDFRTVCRRFDPQGVFRNDFTASALGLEGGARSPERTPSPPVGPNGIPAFAAG